MGVRTAEPNDQEETATRKHEGLAFFLLVMVIMPALAVAVVGSYGLAVWVFQTFTGPPS
ncbi:MAG: periplasmic nitrate reductase, NapE protein [Gammaproteobacteria bacterium]|nr:periplasmic nitrate reductase, NapE protein [Gammaproteobacteria bacterium]